MSNKKVIIRPHQIWYLNFKTVFDIFFNFDVDLNISIWAIDFDLYISNLISSLITFFFFFFPKLDFIKHKSRASLKIKIWTSQYYTKFREKKIQSKTTFENSINQDDPARRKPTSLKGRSISRNTWA